VTGTAVAAPVKRRGWWRWLRATGCLAGVGLLLALTTGGAEAQQRQDFDSANAMLPHCKRFLDTAGKGTFAEGLCAGSITKPILCRYQEGRKTDGAAPPRPQIEPGVPRQPSTRVLAFLQGDPQQPMFAFRIAA
jgi:hypothetical protein